MTTITLKNVSFTTQNNTIIHNISTVFLSGKVTALIGPSGAGKTTLLKLINGLISPTTGDIQIDELSIQALDLVALKKTIGLALQSAPMIQGTVYDNLNLPKAIFNQSLSHKEAKDLLDALNLESIDLLSDVKKLSGGQRQRLSIARTLVNQPKVLLLDEITSSLDPRSVREVESLIHKINQRYNVTVIWITHDVEQAKRATDYYCLLKDGNVITTGASCDLFHSDNETLNAFLKGDIK
ncbi:ATP-binding cassette domain-containing protein [Macrococcus caseolyticus]|nr:ATP-binding cassette domain-containing protein [Macrococcus caseolyticus]MCE4955799.1 ATP-binding cassette domain-containing protein [Macrococcus caseolyticus]